MKKTIQNLVAIAMIVGFSNNVMAQNTATVTNDASATIIAPIAITKGVDMKFGAIIKGAGTVVLSTGSVKSSEYQAIAGNQEGTVTAATFNISGEKDYTYAITLPANETVVLTETGLETMAVNDFTSLTTTTTGSLTGALNGTGTDVVTVGATLSVSGTQASGVYTGTFDITVAYN